MLEQVPTLRRPMLVVLSLGALAPVAAAVAADGQVHDLGSDNFTDAIKANPFSFVEFYAPWCGHCKKLVPEWEKTAELCKDSVMIAKVDSIAEKSLAQDNEVQSFPTLRLFKKKPKVSVKYEGPRTGEKMAEWAKAKTSETLLGSLERAAVKSWAAGKPIAVVGLFSGDEKQDAALRKVLEDVSFALNPAKPGDDVPVGVAPNVDATFFEGLGVSEQSLPSVALLRDFDFEEKVLFFNADGSWKKSFDPLMKWIAAKRVPALIPGSEQTEKFFLSDIDPGNGVVMYFGEDDGLRRGLHELAVDFSTEKRLKWVHLKNNDFGESVGKMVGLTKSDFPEVAVWEFGETEDADKVYRLSQQTSGADVTKAEVEAFVKDWQRGEISAEKDPVTAVTSDTFDSIVINNEKDVLVEFYAPWCGHCKALAPEYKLVAQHYASDQDIGIVKMDSTVHKHPSADVKSYPTLKLYRKGKKSEPLDGEFKTTRNKDGIVQFVEENRVSNSKKGGKGASKKETPAKPVVASSPPPSATPEPPSPHAEKAGIAGIWIFDDATDPESRGKELTSQMVRSTSGYTLVQVGGIGLLLFPGQTGAKAVRHFESKAAAQAYVASLQTPATAASRSQGSGASAACPKDATIDRCKDWCDAVVPGESAQATFGGAQCSEETPDARPVCTCYDKGYVQTLAMCVGSCSGPAAKAVDAEPAETGTCAAGDATCAAQQKGNDALPLRYVLYDTKYGEGFNLQREVYPRAGWVVAKANQALKAKCGKKKDGECARWVLVLPPWCQVVHWWTGPNHVSWKTFFDAEALNSSKVKVIEFDEYVRRVGGQHVDLAVSLETDKLKAQKDKLQGPSQGKFVGFASSLGECSTKYMKPLEFQKLPSGEFQIVYAGHCEGGIAVKDLRCAGLDGPWPEGVVDLVTSQPSSVESILLKNYDYLLAPENDQLDDLRLRESMFYSEELRLHGDRFIASALKGKAYLAAHCRRTDFLRAREKTTPDVSNIAKKLNELLEQQGLEQVFIATDAQDDLRSELQKQVKGVVVFYDEKNGASTFDHKGKQAIVESWISARADFFIGTIESRFTMSIQLERSFLGKPQATSEQEFCKDFSEKPCKAPPYRHRGHPGILRDSYLK